MIDWDRVSELRDEIGADDFAEVVEIFIEEVDGAIEGLGDGSDPLESQFHFLKGSALNLGFKAFAEICQDGEKRASEGDNTIELPPVVTCYRASREEFMTGLASQSAA